MSRLKSNEMKLHFLPLMTEAHTHNVRRRRHFEILNDLTTLKPPKNRLRRLKRYMNYLREGYELSECMN